MSQSGTSLQAYGLKVGGNVLFRSGVDGHGADQPGGRRGFGGSVDLGGAALKNLRIEDSILGGTALNLSGAKISGNLVMRRNVFDQRPFTVDGRVNLSGTQVDGDVVCDGGAFRNPRGCRRGRGERSGGRGGDPGRHACGRAGCPVAVGFFQRRALVSLFGAQIGGTLDCSGGLFDNEVDRRGSGQGGWGEGDVVGRHTHEGLAGMCC